MKGKMKKFAKYYVGVIAIALSMTSFGVQDSKAAATPTKLIQNAGKWQLVRDGKPYIIKGAGGSGPLHLLKERGGNSNRTWGSDNIDRQLDEAQKLGMTYTV